MSSPHRFSYTNNAGTALRLTVEPWADEYVVQAGQRVDVLVVGDDSGGYVEFEQLAQEFVIHGYSGCVITLSSDGKELKPVAQL
jgi:hypothetical protein